jgi:hypothetical protein
VSDLASANQAMRETILSSDSSTCTTVRSPMLEGRGRDCDACLHRRGRPRSASSIGYGAAGATMPASCDHSTGATRDRGRAHYPCRCVKPATAVSWGRRGVSSVRLSTAYGNRRGRLVRMIHAVREERRKNKALSRDPRLVARYRLQRQSD